MRGSNEAEVVIAFRAENEASAELEDIRNEAREADRGFQGLDRSVIATGLGFLGLGFGAKEAISNFQEFNKSQGEIQATLDLLGPAAQRAFDELKPAFDDIGETVAATEREVAEAFAIIIANSGGIAPSVDELAGAFDVARAKGVSFEAAAAAIGFALQGNLEPLQELLDPSGRRSIPSLAAGLEDVKGASRDAITPIDRLAKSFKELGDELSKAANIVVGDPFGNLVTGPTLDAIEEFDRGVGAIIEKLGLSGLIGLAGGESAPTGGGLQVPSAAEYSSRLGLAQGQGYIGVGGGVLGQPAQQLVFNISIGGQAIDPVVILLEQHIRNNNRNGINIDTP